MTLDIGSGFEFVDIKVFRPRATIHASGKLGFNKDARSMMRLKEAPSFIVAKPKGELSPDILKLIESKDASQACRVAKAGNYYYLNIKSVFDQLGYDYRKDKITFNISQADDINGMRCFLLERHFESDLC